jgi:hypothetical protein
LDDVTLNDLKDWVDVGERFLVDFILSPIHYLLAELLSGREEIFDDEGLVGKLVEVFIGEFRGLGLALVYLLRLGLFFTLLKLGLV